MSCLDYIHTLFQFINSHVMLLKTLIRICIYVTLMLWLFKIKFSWISYVSYPW